MREQEAAEEHVGGLDRERTDLNIVLHEFQARMVCACFGYVALRRIQADGTIWSKNFVDKLRGPSRSAPKVNRKTNRAFCSKLRNRTKQGAAFRLVHAGEEP